MGMTMDNTGIEYLRKRNEELEIEVRELQLFRNLHNEFPTMLRKMWSGSEVVEWIKQKQSEYKGS